MAILSLHIYHLWPYIWLYVAIIWPCMAIYDSGLAAPPPPQMVWSPPCAVVRVGGGSCDQRRVSTSFSRIWKQKVRDVFPKFKGNQHILRGRLENEQLRLDCADASGSRVWPPSEQKQGKTTCESKHTYDAGFLRKVARRISPKRMKISPLAHRNV